MICHLSIDFLTLVFLNINIFTQSSNLNISNDFPNIVFNKYVRYDIDVVSLFHVYNIVFDFLSNYIQQKSSQTFTCLIHAMKIRAMFSIRSMCGPRHVSNEKNPGGLVFI